MKNWKPRQIGTKTVEIGGVRYIVRVYAQGKANGHSRVPKGIRRLTQGQSDSKHKEKISQFWTRFGKVSIYEQKIAALKEYAQIVIFDRNKESLDRHRHSFSRNKGKLGRMLRRPRPCWACGSPATCRHHIIQLQNGGINSKRNVIPLCDACHALIHPWL